MTEQEAKTKWCPFARAAKAVIREGQLYIEGTQPVINRYTTDSWSMPSGAICIGSSCMAWRWIDVPWEKKRENETGFCGLAGKL